MFWVLRRECEIEAELALQGVEADQEEEEGGVEDLVVGDGAVDAMAERTRIEMM